MANEPNAPPNPADKVGTTTATKAAAATDDGGTITFAKIEDLLLDPNNPRLPESVARDSQSMLDHIAQTTAIEELMDAIGENGFFPGEPLIVVPVPAQPGKYIVVEGNRRLTAAKLLRDPSHCSQPGERMREISKNAKYRPEELPVVVQANREGVLPYLGFRHITGIKQWEPLAKARYIEQLFAHTDEKSTPRDRYGEIARTIGSRRDHIKRNLDALAVYRAVKERDFYGIDGLNDESLKFSVLSTAIADDRIGAFVGVAKRLEKKSENEKDDYEPTNPIVNPESLLKGEIEELTRWLFERDAKGKTRVGESRNLRQLSAVVASPRALEALRKNATLKIAYQLTSDLTRDFVELLYQAEAALVEATGMVANVQYEDDAYQAARRLSENIKLIGRELKGKQKADDDEF